MTPAPEDQYVPDDLWLDSPTRLVEITPPRPDTAPLHGRVALGLPDALNRQPERWSWADISGNGTHWSDFRGHRIQVDIQLHTENWHDVNAWKGRDEIRPGGTWTLALNRQQCWEGYLHLDPLNVLIEIRRIGLALMEHSAIDWSSDKSAAEQLVGRKVYYGRTPAVVSSASVLSQGCVMLKPIGVDAFPPAVHELDRDGTPYLGEREEIKTELLDPNVWWWRDKPAGDEPPLPTPGPEQCVPAPEGIPAAGCAKDCEGDCCG